jgi:hypothetical protein
MYGRNLARPKGMSRDLPAAPHLVGRDKSGPYSIWQEPHVGSCRRLGWKLMVGKICCR